MNSIWEILGIEPTNSKKEIYSAYLAQAKVYHLEENLETFERLYKAYQTAIEYASIEDNEENGEAEIVKEDSSECLMFLYDFVVQTERVPNVVLEDIYERYHLRDIESIRKQKLYAQLKQVILKQYPDIEKVLYGEDSKSQMIRSWYKEMRKILSANRENYEKRIYQETEQIKEQIQQLFARSEWKKIQYEPELFDKMFFQFHDRKVTPVSLAKQLIAFYSQERLWEDKEKVQLILEGLVQSLGFHRRMIELDSFEPLEFEKTQVEDISDDNQDFWQYYLMRGFGFRNVKLDDVQEKRDYELGNRCYLPDYISTMYYPSFPWQKIFTNFNSKENRIICPVSVEFMLPNQKKMKVEFHLHYILYFLDGTRVNRPKYTFDECMEFSKYIEKTEHFFFLLAITSIKKEERSKAIELIETWLKKLSLFPITIPMIASLLAEDNARDDKEEQIETIYYIEQEYFCFRAIVTEEQVIISHQERFDWKDIYTVDLKQSYSAKSIEDRKKIAWNILQKFQQPLPISLAVHSLEGMNKKKKAKIILKFLKRHETYRRNTDFSPYIPTYSKEETLDSVTKFFQKEDGFLTESYCVLRYGSEKKQERIFYCAINPFGFDLVLQNPEFVSGYHYQLDSLKKEIKENYFVVGHFGWGQVYTQKGGFGPQAFAIGESGTYYAYSGIHLYQTKSLSKLLAKLFDFTDVTEIEIYQGYLSISCFEQRLEYCYGKEAFQESMYYLGLTKSDLFTRFTKAERMMELGMWLDDIFEFVPKLYIVYFKLDWETGNFFSIDIFNRLQVEYKEKEAELGESLLGEKKKLVWKSSNAWNTTLTELKESIQWYLNNGRNGKKLKCCLKIDVGIFFEREKRAMEKTIYEVGSSV